MDANVEARERSRTTWNEMAAGWEGNRDALWQDSHAVGTWLVERLAPQPGATILELAAGVGDTGLLAAQWVGPSGMVVITDFATEMVAAAQRRAAELGVRNARFQVLDAEHMDLPTASVDGVLCRWGYMLMLDPAAAFAETRRVLRPGGRLAFSVWGDPARNPWATDVRDILVARGHIPPPDPTKPGIFALADPQRLRTLVTAAGFAEPEIVELPTYRLFPDFAAYWTYLTELAGAISPTLRSLAATEQEEIQATLREASAPYLTPSGYNLPRLCLNVVTS